YHDHYQEYFDKYLDEDQRAELTAQLGFSPRLALHVHASNAYERSRELAREVCEALVKQWGGGWGDGAKLTFQAPIVERSAAVAARDVPARPEEKKAESPVHLQNYKD